MIHLRSSLCAPYMHPMCTFTCTLCDLKCTIHICTLHAPFEHPWRILIAQCTLHVPYFQSMFILHAPYVHSTCTLHTFTCTLHAPYVHPIYTQCASYMQLTCTFREFWLTNGPTTANGITDITTSLTYNMDKFVVALKLKYKTIRETNCSRKHSLSDLLLLCLPILYWRACAFWRERLGVILNKETMQDAVVNWNCQLTWRKYLVTYIKSWFSVPTTSLKSLHAARIIDKEPVISLFLFFADATRPRHAAKQVIVRATVPQHFKTKSGTGYYTDSYRNETKCLRQVPFPALHPTNHFLKTMAVRFNFSYLDNFSIFYQRGDLNKGMKANGKLDCTHHCFTPELIWPELVLLTQLIHWIKLNVGIACICVCSLILVLSCLYTFSTLEFVMFLDRCVKEHITLLNTEQDIDGI